MADETKSVPEPKPTPKRRAAQNRQMEADVIAGEILINALKAEQEVQAELEEGGYGTAELTRATAVQKTAWSTFVIQGQAEGAQTAATRLMRTAERSVWTSYRLLRGLGKSAFMKDPDGRRQLRLDGGEPVGLKNLIGAARALADSGSQPEFAAKLAKKGVTAAKLAALNSKVDALVAADQAQEAAKVAAPKARKQRDADAQELFDWVAEFKMFAKNQFKDRPDVLKRWGI